MASRIAKKAAGTYIADSLPKLPKVIAWLTLECRSGALAAPVHRFCAAQPEILEPAAVLVESVTDNCILCRIPFAAYDHESTGTFGSEVRFSLDPKNGVCRRL